MHYRLALDFAFKETVRRIFKISWIELSHITTASTKTRKINSSRS